MRQKTLSKVVLNLVLLMVVFIILFPVFYIVQTSLKSTADIYSGTFFFTAKSANYEEIFTGSRSNFADLTRNSLVVSASVAVICGFIGSLAAYSVSRLSWSRWVTGGILIWLLFINMMPPIVFVTPYYLWARAAGIYDSPLGRHHGACRPEYAAGGNHDDELLCRGAERTGGSGGH